MFANGKRCGDRALFVLRREEGSSSELEAIAPLHGPSTLGGEKGLTLPEKCLCARHSLAEMVYIANASPYRFFCLQPVSLLHAPLDHLVITS